MTSTKSLVIRVSALALACALPIVPALASGPVAPPPQVVDYVMPAPAFDWAGAYGGLSVSSVSGRINENTGGGVFPDLDSDTGFGGFVGYNWQRGNFVFGGELSYTSFDTAYVGFPVSFQQNVLELRARAGYSFDRVLAYGFVGAARSRLDDAGTIYNQTGVTYGLGVQAMIARNFFAGLEVARRDVSDTVGGATIGSDIDTITLRIGYQF